MDQLVDTLVNEQMLANFVWSMIAHYSISFAHYYYSIICSQLYVEYTNVAVKGAVAAVDGNIPPINCSEHVKYVHAHTIMSSDWLFLAYTGNACSSGITYFSHLPLMVVTTTQMLVVSYCSSVNCVCGIATGGYGKFIYQWLGTSISG